MNKQFVSFLYTGKKSDCTGCGACLNICSHSAITMIENTDGFMYPRIDKNKCIECGLCDMICPVVNYKGNNPKYDQKCYIGTTSLEQYYMESASIGICTMVAEYIIEQKGVVFGVELDEKKWIAKHTKITDKNDLYRFRNSKYLQSFTGNTFEEVKHFLKDGVFVLYTGTPCQIAGLKTYLKKDYDNLYTIDIICHGVFSPKLMPLEIIYWEKLFHGKISNFRFRSKRKYCHVNGGMVNFDILHENGIIEHIERHASSSPSYRCYAYSGDGYSYNIRLSCYSCPFKSAYRYGDLTVGDPWSIDGNAIKKRTQFHLNSVSSLYFTNTFKGEFLLKAIISKLDYQEISHDIAFRQAALLPINREIPLSRDVLFERIEKDDYGQLIEKILNCKLEESHRSFEKKYKKNILKRYIKHILGYE